jgi:hypothetical protein
MGRNESLKIRKNLLNFVFGFSEENATRNRQHLMVATFDFNLKLFGEFVSGAFAWEQG